ncbi:hypothetical protein ACIU1J_27605 [Azospirillum doebereinerae]|uniref:terminase small subunit-like protein n=1 Tax=Azospirillum doebereinerae TaxID=92933 RepID=UPI001EE51FAE|nr:hypothetical protein [Azospirillum doebereinerae]MCG5241387.1 hypothetical protein [Azospirillum doebereinerae]
MARTRTTKRPDAQPDEPQRLDLPDHAATPPAKHPGGRPVVWTPERIAETKPAILDALADGQSIRTVTALPDMPSWSTLREWLRSDVEFASQYARAREAAADQLAARVVDIADKVADGKLDAQQGRTAIDGYKWAASKLNARVYGDRIDLNHSGNLTVTPGWVVDLTPPDQGGPLIVGDAEVVLIEGCTPSESSDE